MVITKVQSRRRRGTSSPHHSQSWVHSEAFLKHKDFVAKIMERMIPLGKKVTMFMVPFGHDVSINQRVSLEIRENLISGAVELFLPKEKLERVTVFKSSIIDKRRYYLVLDEGVSHTRIVWGRYCVPLDSEELLLALLPKKKRL